MNGFGRLERVDLRTGWLSEARDFTPWLAREDNLSLLGEALTLELQLEAQEQAVGPFRADILCKDRSDNWVLIENQLERSDHTHLGQLLTYAAGLHAVTIIWIAARFAEEHRAACDWLNEITAENVRIFAIEIELWRIGESPIAPKFNIVCQPNGWSKFVTAAKKQIEDASLITSGRQKQLAYWTIVEDMFSQQKGSVRAVRPQPQSWLWHALGRTGTGLSLAMNTQKKWVRVDVTLTGRYSKQWYQQLEQHKDKIEAQLSSPFDWQPLPHANEARISCYLREADPFDETDWSRQHAWLISTANAVHDIFSPIIKSLGQGSESITATEFEE